MVSQRDGVEAVPLEHGGDLDAARRQFPAAPQPFVDLSTGINPHPYPFAAPSAEAFGRLPDPAMVERLAAAAAEFYGAPSAAHVVPAPGTQILIAPVAALVPPGRAAVLSPTYAEHAAAARHGGHRVEEVAGIDGLAGADLAVVVNPNNPDGRRVTRETLLACAGRLAPGGLLVVDEAFMDASMSPDSLAGDVAGGRIVVLRSFGKFFGLAGLRLGFAIASADIAARLRATLGPWAVSGPAIAIGTAALVDKAWAEAMRLRLAREMERLEQILLARGLEIIGGTSLFRLTRTPVAAALFEHLGRAGILVRRFAGQVDWLRFGLPGEETEWQRLEAALASFDFAAR
jgi:cobalamin biosynthetic protein CobC